MYIHINRWGHVPVIKHQHKKFCHENNSIEIKLVQTPYPLSTDGFSIRGAPNVEADTITTTPLYIFVVGMYAIFGGFYIFVALIILNLCQNKDSYKCPIF
jgi:hypothetical protein